MDTPEISPNYIVNPDVVLREEDPDGGLLFNPDTNQVRVINNTGLFVWKLCDGTKSMESITAEIGKNFDQVPPDEVDGQVKTFMDDMIQNGFIGILEDEGENK
jgi:hypothetical protein